MTLEGAINFHETTDYIIYTMNSATTGQYGVVMPKNISGAFNMLVDLHMKGSFDGVSTGLRKKEQLVEEINEEYSKLKAQYMDGMLVMPMIDEVSFQNAVTNNDKQKMFDEVKKIGAITSELYKKLTDSGVEKQKIDQKIIIVEKGKDDENFVSWLKIQMPNFVDGILYHVSNESQQEVNPFMNTQDLFAQAAEEPKVEVASSGTSVVSGGGIFDTVSPTVPVEPVVSSAPSSESNLDTSSTVPNSNVDIFGISNDIQGVNNTEVVSGVTANSSVVDQSLSNDLNVNSVFTVDTPKPVESASLDGTTTFQPISDDLKVQQEGAGSEESDGGTVTDHASKGFANLLILFVVLIGVTIVSIELGKFLYSVYGA